MGRKSKQLQVIDFTKPINETEFCWVIAYINNEYIERVGKDLRRYEEYRAIEVYIPTVKILKKTFKGENRYQEIPLALNYGFFKIPRKLAVHRSFLDNMKVNISCIFSWVNDSMKAVRGSKFRFDQNNVYKDGDVPAATATSTEIAKLVEASYYCSIYDKSEIDKLCPGTIITLRGYPFEGMQAEVEEVLPKKQKVKVKMFMMDQVRSTMVEFDNVFFTIYHNKSYDDSVIFANSIALTENFDNYDEG